MAHIILITGLTQAQRQTDIHRILHGEVSLPALPPDYLYLVPSRRKVTYTEDRLLKQAGKAWIPAVYTLNELAKKIYSRLGGNKRPIGELSQRLILSSLLTRSGSGWEFFNPQELTPGLLKKTAQFMAQIKTCRRENLARSIRQYRSPADLQAKDRDLINLFQHYQQFLAEKSLADPQDILIESTGLLAGETPAVQALPHIKRLVIDGFYYFNPLEQKFIKAIIKVFEQTVVSVDSNHPPTEEDHQLLTDYLDFWQQLGSSAGHTLKPITPSKTPISYNPEFMAISKRLFKPARSMAGSTPDLIIRSPFSRQQEVRAIARNIRQIISQYPATGLAGIYVVFPKMEIYAPLVQEIFPNYGIAYEITKGYPLQASPITRAALRLLAIKLNGYRREDWCALFASQLIEYSRHINPPQWADFIGALDVAPATARQLFDSPPVGKRQLNMPLIEQWARRANLKGGANWQRDWLAPLVNLIDGLRLDKDQQAEAYRQLYLFKSAWAEFDGLPDSLTGQQFAEGLLGLIERFGILKNIIGQLKYVHNYADRDKQIILKRDFRALDKLNSILQQFTSGLKLINRENHELPLAELHALLLDYLSSEEYHTTDHTEDRVQVVESLELRGLYFEYLFWGGLSENEFPRPEPQALFYPAAGSKRMFELLPRLTEDRYLYSYMFKNTNRQISLSYPLTAQGKPRLPSPFIEELQQITATDIHKPEETAPTCYTRQELLGDIAAGLNKGTTPLVKLKALKQLDAEGYFQLLHILKVDNLRQSGRAFSSYEGLLDSAANIEYIKQLNPGARYNVTQLEDYAGCPLGYFFKHVLKLNPVEEIIADFKPPDRGSLLHNILEEFYRRRIKNYAHSPGQVKITPDNLEEASQQMLQSAERVLSGFRTKYRNLFWENEKQGLLAGLTPEDDRQTPGILRSFLEHEALSIDRLTPRYVEFRFGKQGAAPALCLGEMQLEGRVDRIDLAMNERLFVVYDYKFGSVPAGSLIRQGYSFQLPVYLLAIADFLKDKGCQIGAGGYYQLKSTHEARKTGYFGRQDIRASRPDELGGAKVLVSKQRNYGLLSDHELSQQLTQVKSRLLHIHKLINQGRFHPPLGAEAALPCRFCDFDCICRVDVLRLAKMYPGLSDQAHYKPLKDTI